MTEKETQESMAVPRSAAVESAIYAETKESEPTLVDDSEFGKSGEVEAKPLDGTVSAEEVAENYLTGLKLAVVMIAMCLSVFLVALVIVVQDMIWPRLTKSRIIQSLPLQFLRLRWNSTVYRI